MSCNIIYLQESNGRLKAWRFLVITPAFDSYYSADTLNFPSDIIIRKEATEIELHRRLGR